MAFFSHLTLVLSAVACKLADLHRPTERHLPERFEASKLQVSLLGYFNSEDQALYFGRFPLVSFSHFVAFQARPLGFGFLWRTRELVKHFSQLASGTSLAQPVIQTVGTNNTS